MLEIVFFGSEAVVFDSLSSSLHLVSALGGELLVLIEQGTPTQQLITYVIDKHDFGYDQASFFIHESLESYSSLDLISGYK